MFKVGQDVNHKRCGACKIVEIAPLASDPKGPKYIVLQPLFGEEKKGIVRVPFDNTVSLSPSLSKKEALAVVAKLKDIKDPYIPDAKKRKLAYEAALSSSDLIAIAGLIEGTNIKLELDARLNSMDLQFLSKAKPVLYGELSVALGIGYEKVEDFIRDHIGR